MPRTVSTLLTVAFAACVTLAAFAGLHAAGAPAGLAGLAGVLTGVMAARA